MIQKLFLGVEIGATKQQLALGDQDGNVLDAFIEKIPLPQGAKSVTDWLEARIPQMMDKAAAFGGEVAAIGAGFGGFLELATGRVLASVQVEGWKDFQLKTWFEQKFSLPAAVYNDTVCGGYGELLLGSGVGARVFFYSNIGSGIGGSLFIDKQYYDGIGFGAMYIGHTYIPDIFASKPGERIKTEDACSGWAIERRLRRPGYIPAGSSLLSACGGDVSRADCRMLHEAALCGDKFALAEVDRVAYAYSIALSNLATLVSPDAISIGGGVANFGELLIAPIRMYTNELAVLPARGRFTGRQCQFMDGAVIVGAMLLASRAWKTHGRIDEL